MANKKVFTDESLATFVSETKLYVNDSVDELSSKVAYIDIEDNENVSDENIAIDLTKYVTKQQGVANVGKFLAVGTDGNLTLVPMPTGGVSGDVIGTLDESNNILLTGNLADGTYSIKYEMDDGSLVDIGSLAVNVSSEPTNFANPSSADWKTGCRLTTDAFQFKTLTGSIVTNFVDVQRGDMVLVEGINFVDSNNRQAFSYGSTPIGIGTVATWEALEKHDTIDNIIYDENSFQFTVTYNDLSIPIIQARFSGMPTGTAEDVKITITRNGKVL